MDFGCSGLRLESDGESDSSELDSASDDDEVSESDDDVSSELVDPSSVVTSAFGSLYQSAFRYGILLCTGGSIGSWLKSPKSAYGSSGCQCSHFLPHPQIPCKKSLHKGFFLLVWWHVCSLCGNVPLVLLLSLKLCNSHQSSYAK